MGEILFRTRLSQSLFRGLTPGSAAAGRLLHVNVIGCTIFAAISGSSAATTQVVGASARPAPEARLFEGRRGRLASRCRHTGFLIPPSNIMIIYGVLGDVSIAKLFTAGFIPGFLLAGCFMAWIMIHTALKPDLVPAAERKVRVASGAEFLASIRELGPAVFPILRSCLLAASPPRRRRRRWACWARWSSPACNELSGTALRAIAIGSVQTCAMIALIVLGASIWVRRRLPWHPLQSPSS
jgi:TRAP-type C4-dicarboxylate transport system permease large subunit